MYANDKINFETHQSKETPENSSISSFLDEIPPPRFSVTYIPNVHNII